MTIDPHRDLLVGQTIGRIEDQPRPLHVPKRQCRRLRAPLKLDAFVSRQLDPKTAGPGHEHHFAASRPPPSHNSTRFRTALLVADRIEHAKRLQDLRTIKQQNRRALFLKGLGYSYREIQTLTGGASYTAVISGPRCQRRRAASVCRRRHVAAESGLWRRTDRRASTTST
jgi:hypothetical protein